MRLACRSFYLAACAHENACAHLAIGGGEGARTLVAPPGLGSFPSAGATPDDAIAAAASCYCCGVFAFEKTVP